ncbi:hypothetical protein BCV70DRAFT_120560 [Testicularia cyperi]|uniref:Uncharacterized protein n=1 Tax=Testicularia cyperi TaxID=1882483 RepID=A0A317XQE9_9BASI|nr:hypothetical protein BCV70DRAFT_120560 [Testicularia cyperi]
MAEARACSTQYSTDLTRNWRGTPPPQSTVQYSTVQYSTVQYSTVQYSTALHCTERWPLSVPGLTGSLAKRAPELNPVLGTQYSTVLYFTVLVCPQLTFFLFSRSGTCALTWTLCKRPSGLALPCLGSSVRPYVRLSVRLSFCQSTGSARKTAQPSFRTINITVQY